MNIELYSRRQKLFDAMEENSVAIIYSGISKIMSEDAEYSFFANTSFYYLTNIKQENSVLLLIKGLGENKTYLFVDEYNELKEKWTGKRLTFDEAKEISSIDNIIATKNFDSFLDLALTSENNQYGNISTCYLDLSPEIKVYPLHSTKEVKLGLEKKYPHLVFNDIKPIITSLRMIKSDYEIECLKKAIERTNRGIKDLICYMKPGLYEYQLADRFEFYGRELSRDGLAFPSIIASGDNGVILHYPTQNSRIKDNSLVLLDLGYRYENYCADISRTYPVNGVFTENQRKVYTAVLNCNKAVIEYIHEGLTLKDLQDFASKILNQECIRLGLMDEGDDIRKYYYHGVSHHLGIDTHDVSDRDKPLESGNVITVEPGLYFKELGIGVRIEDDVLVTKGKAEVLSKDIFKEIDDIEKLFKTKIRG
ncbi:MAG: aminopeptidase P N-terminal domain-containing protein [Bacilli bacterium]